MSAKASGSLDLTNTNMDLDDSLHGTSLYAGAAEKATVLHKPLRG